MNTADIDAAVRQVLAPVLRSRKIATISDFHVLRIVAIGIILILLAIIVGLFLTPRALPNWAENVFVSIATASALKLGDCISAIVALSSGRSVDRLGEHLAQTAPIGEPQTVKVEQPPNEPIPVETKP